MLAPLIFISRPELPECLLGWFLKSCHTLRAGPCSPQLPWGAWHGSSLPPFTAWVSHPKPQATEPGILWLRSSWVRNMEILWVFYGTVTSFFLQLARCIMTNPTGFWKMFLCELNVVWRNDMLFTDAFNRLQFDWLLKKTQSIYFQNDCMISAVDNPLPKYWK